ncbi:MAG: Uma2 family endonuclease [Microcoleus sp. PH2017_10_PVI_O_A]|uniref:Uma2 family endonuclease n=1 Tax=unclassified Microcoleus TaxID=2642155 RepID=UPI001D7F459C|nr:MULTISPECIES: Uma2 family endonuclease [unclassified Microcoleus]TAE84061.1 MAG: Uma2 family endonuclease [Oscillatoriales cyanobacterium]MCC3405619.1 Uma2 family endonuclease [Microcoleus sp. PH2017_10_PVI_O_A]MCC3459614.1 Uma2 family endonuclease [Microcoleus sp. PH2017_11_PCY_U_A]MCC3478084.1 Uma2 family endonuclease [Microcoleus sp. PH2017_12_PCY_D_A]MCC3528074.1 Uma2 family endonuclease [Microcoleus sp. PH2017_21_RUC_O_A]
MTATLILPETPQKPPEQSEKTQPENVISLEEFLAKPPERMEWVDGNLVEKTGMTFKHSLAQSKLARYWGNYKDSSGQGGEVLTEILCRTAKQGRRPDVAYITPELLPQSGNFTSFSQSFPLIAEVASPEDSAEELFAKAQEYLESGCQEVWLLFPEARLVFVNAGQGWRLFNPNEVVNTQTVLAGFSIAVSELLA